MVSGKSDFKFHDQIQIDCLLSAESIELCFVGSPFTPRTHRVNFRFPFQPFGSIKAIKP